MRQGVDRFLSGEGLNRGDASALAPRRDGVFRKPPRAGETMRKTGTAVLWSVLIGLALMGWGPGLVAQPADAPPDITGLSAPPEESPPLEESPLAEDRLPPDYEVTIRSELDAPEGSLTAGSALSHQVIVSWRGADTDLDVQLPAHDPFRNLHLERMASTRRAHAAPDGRVSEAIYTFHLKALEPGPAAIPSVRVDYRIRGDETLRTLRLPEVALTIRAADRGFSRRDALLISGVIAVAVLMLAGLLLTVIARRRAPQAPPPPFAERHAAAIQAARQCALSGDQPGFCTATARLARAVLAEGAALSADRREIAEALAARCEEGRFAPRPFSREELERQQKKLNDILSWMDS